jgi:hypothetical protein
MQLYFLIFPLPTPLFGAWNPNYSKIAKTHTLFFIYATVQDSRTKPQAVLARYIKAFMVATILGQGIIWVQNSQSPMTDELREHLSSWYHLGNWAQSQQGMLLCADLLNYLHRLFLNSSPTPLPLAICCELINWRAEMDLVPLDAAECKL